MIDNLTDAIAYERKEAEVFTETSNALYRDFYQISLNCQERANYHELLAALLTELQERREADRWIPVSERLPDKNGNYLVCLNNGEMTTDIFDEEELFMGFWGYMTHWRPLPPKPYESEAENGTDN